jgi:ubiquinone/menaquinone biosynthesis C-methylase UbiE
MEAVLQIAIWLSCGFVVLLLIYILITKKLLFNHKLLAFVAKKFYNYFYSIEGITHLRVNNYGYAPVDEEIAVYPQELQYGMQLYKELIKNHNGYMIPEYSSMVEIGCGKGAGAEFLIRKFKPEKFIGLDYSTKAIDYCVKNYKPSNNVNFICADAHQLPIENGSIDIVVNVESSHIFKDQSKFFKEVNRVLKCKGKFLFTDYRYVKQGSIDKLENEIICSGFKISEKRFITPQIYHACFVASKIREDIINRASPWYLKKYFGHYAGLYGTKKYAQFGNGEIIYFIYHLEKES